MSRFTRVAVSVVAAGSLVGAAVAAPAVAPSKQAAAKRNIVQTAVAAGQFKTLVSLVKSTGLAPALSGKKKLTVFAPTDAAFARVPASTLQMLQNDRAMLKKVLLYHVVGGQVKAKQVLKLRSAKTLAGPSLRVSTRGGAAYVNDARIVKTDVAASNGVIHVVNRVLIPPAS